MPALILQSNVKVDDEKAFVLEFSKLAAETLNKPELYISISYTHNPTLTFAGSFDPAFLLDITSLGNINEDVNEVYSQVFFDYFKRTLGVPGDRGYIVFNDPGRAFIGHKGTTTAAIFGKS